MIQNIIDSVTLPVQGAIINLLLANYGQEINGEFVLTPKKEKDVVSFLALQGLDNPVYAAFLSVAYSDSGSVYSLAKSLRGKAGVYRSEKALRDAQAKREAAASGSDIPDDYGCELFLREELEAVA